MQKLNSLIAIIQLLATTWSPFYSIFISQSAIHLYIITGIKILARDVTDKMSSVFGLGLDIFEMMSGGLGFSVWYGECSAPLISYFYNFGKKARGTTGT